MNTSLIKVKNSNCIDINKIGPFDPNDGNSRLLHFVPSVQHSSSQHNKGTMHVYRYITLGDTLNNTQDRIMTEVYKINFFLQQK